jgi:hypothetical protein
MVPDSGKETRDVQGAAAGQIATAVPWVSGGRTLENEGFC